MLACETSVWPCGQYASPKSTTSSQSKISRPEIQVIGARLVGGGPDGARTEPGAGPVRRRDVERRADDGHVGPPRLELFDLGQERPVPERHQSRIGQVELLGHAGRKLSLMIVIVSWPMG